MLIANIFHATNKGNHKAFLEEKMIKPVKLGVAAGLVWGVAVFLTTLFATWTAYGKAFIQVMMSMYIGLDFSWGGAFIGFIWGFVYVFIGFGILAWLYNKMTCCGCCGGNGHDQHENKQGK